jgi:hypothetical protein
MDTITTQSQTETKQAPKRPATLSEADLLAKRKEQEALRAKAQAEANAYASKLQALLKEGAELGGMALDSLAESLGASANKAGRPTESAFLAFTAAVAHRKLSYDRRADLCRKANAVCKEEHKPVARITSKANAQRGSQTYAINQPVALAENIGAE